MNYFSFYDYPIRFFIDESGLKKSYYEKMRDLHPDMHVGSSVEEQQEILAKSSYNNKAYKTLKDLHSRLKYIVELLGDGTERKMPPHFLMEMMEVNEDIMELQMDPNDEKKQTIRNSVEGELNDLYLGLEPFLKQADEDDNIGHEVIIMAEEYLLKRNYLMRLLDQLS